MTDHKYTWSVGMTNLHAWIQSPSLVHDIFDYTCRFESVSLYLSLFSLCTSQTISFFFQYCFSPLLIILSTTQPGFESSLENTFSWFFDLFLVLGVILHNYFQNDHSKSKVLGYMTAQHLILISTSGFKFIVYLYVLLWVLSISFSFFLCSKLHPAVHPAVHSAIILSMEYIATLTTC